MDSHRAVPRIRRIQSARRLLRALGWLVPSSAAFGECSSWLTGQVGLQPIQREYPLVVHSETVRLLSPKDWAEHVAPAVLVQACWLQQQLQIVTTGNCFRSRSPSQVRMACDL